MNFQIGSSVGDYQVVGILGAGGMGKVYKVRNTITDRVEAMKVLLPDLVHEPELADRFQREIKVQASLEHPNIAALHTAVRVENQLLMLMEFVEGETLEQKLKRGPLGVDEAVNDISQVLAALDYAHARGVIHRDIKPANMMITPEGVLKLMDFGIAKAANDRRLTMTGTTMGSLYYMSPEQIQGSANLDARADLYSVGVSLYELVTGKKPFDGDSQFAIMSAHLEKNPVPPITLDPRLPQALNDAILISVGRDPNARFQTAGAFRNALANVAPPAVERQAITAPVAEAPPAVAPATPPVAPVVAAPRSKRGLWMALGAVAAALAVVAFIQFGPRIGTKAAPQTSPPAAQSVPATKPAPAPVAEQPPVSPPAQQPAVPAPSSSQAANESKQKPARADQRVAARPSPERPAPSQQQQQQAQPSAPPESRQAAAPQPPAQQPPAVNPAELQQARETFVMLNTRADGIRGTLQSLQQAQAARGLNLSSALQEPANLMNNYLGGADAALQAGDLASAKSFMDKAERQIEKLEKLLNR